MLGARSVVSHQTECKIAFSVFRRATQQTHTASSSPTAMAMAKKRKVSVAVVIFGAVHNGREAHWTANILPFICCSQTPINALNFFSRLRRCVCVCEKKNIGKTLCSTSAAMNRVSVCVCVAVFVSYLQSSTRQFIRLRVCRMPGHSFPVEMSRGGRLCVCALLRTKIE